MSVILDAINQLAAVRLFRTIVRMSTNCYVRDLVVAIAVSPSTLESDLWPTRLGVAQHATAGLLSEMKRVSTIGRVAIVGFGGTAKIVWPLLDIAFHEMASSAVHSIKVIEGASFADGLIAAEACFHCARSRPGAKEILLLSDGGDNGELDPVAIADELRRDGCLIRTRGFGGHAGLVDEELLGRIASVGDLGFPLYKFHRDANSLIEDFREIGRITR